MHSAFILVQITAATFIVVMFKVFEPAGGKIVFMTEQMLQHQVLDYWRGHRRPASLQGSKQKCLNLARKYGVGSCEPWGFLCQDSCSCLAGHVKVIKKMYGKFFEFHPTQTTCLHSLYIVLFTSCSPAPACKEFKIEDFTHIGHILFWAAVTQNLELWML